MYILFFKPCHNCLQLGGTLQLVGGCIMYSWCLRQWHIDGSLISNNSGFTQAERTVRTVQDVLHVQSVLKWLAIGQSKSQASV